MKKPGAFEWFGMLKFLYHEKILTQYRYFCKSKNYQKLLVI
jgi:hypothetical protein